MKKTLIWSSLIILTILLFIVGIFLYIDGAMCGNQIHKTYVAPNKKHKAIIFQRDCGATTGFSTQISIIGNNDKLDNSSGNIYIIKGHPDEVAPTLKWMENNHLFINNIKSKTEYKKEKDLYWWNSIKISYEK